MWTWTSQSSTWTSVFETEKNKDNLEYFKKPLLHQKGIPLPIACSSPPPWSLQWLLTFYRRSFRTLGCYILGKPIWSRFTDGFTLLVYIHGFSLFAPVVFPHLLPRLCLTEPCSSVNLRIKLCNANAIPNHLPVPTVIHLSWVPIWPAYVFLENLVFCKVMH